jgi:hypothetical protein
LADTLSPNGRAGKDGLENAGGVPDLTGTLSELRNGAVAQIAVVTSRCEAQSIAATFEERGHKQLYWVEQRSTAA